MGKGLSALLGEDFSADFSTPSSTLPISQIESYQNQPRKNFNQEKLEELAESIRQHGVIQPLTVRKLASGYYQIIAGERRWRAARMAGLDEVPAVVIEADDQKAMELAMIENLQREDLNPIEEAEGFRALTEVYGMTQAQAAERVGKSRSAVANALRLLELNISCPNVEEGGLAFGTAPRMVERVVQAVRHYTGQPLTVKLSPEVTDITEIARAAVSGGADALSLINTLRGMKIDIHRRRAVLASKTGGYSGPGIMPVALRMVYEVCKSVDVPVIGMGGIATFEDALEFIMVGAAAVAVGTANFHNPYATVEIIEGIRGYLEENDIASLDRIRGIVD
jgi:dihydroorotate dehydrogenase subfamily 1